MQLSAVCFDLQPTLRTPRLFLHQCLVSAVLQDGIIAAKRIDMSKKGVETCGDVDEVRVLSLDSCR